MEASMEVMLPRRQRARCPNRARRARRAAARLGALAMLVAVAALMLNGERWLFENNPASVMVVMAHAGKLAGASDGRQKPIERAIKVDSRTEAQR